MAIADPDQRHALGKVLAGRKLVLQHAFIEPLEDGDRLVKSLSVEQEKAAQFPGPSLAARDLLGRIERG